jgi:hypothetical protein
MAFSTLPMIRLANSLTATSSDEPEAGLDAATAGLAGDFTEETGGAVGGVGGLGSRWLIDSISAGDVAAVAGRAGYRVERDKKTAAPIPFEKCEPFPRLRHRNCKRYDTRSKAAALAVRFRLSLGLVEFSLRGSECP